MYEGFAETQQQQQPQTQQHMAAVAGESTASGPSATTSPALTSTSPNAPTTVEPSTAVTNSAPSTLPQTSAQPSINTEPSVDHLLRGLEAIQTPNLGGSAPEQFQSPTATVVQTNTMRSTPGQPVNQAQDSGKSLLQGAAFQSTKPTAPVVIVEKHYVQEQSAPGCAPTKPKCAPKPSCPPPSCPDMTDYIRKDSIPCWGCKLK